MSPLYDDVGHHHYKVWNDGHDIRIFGHGTLSGDFIPHPNYADPPVSFRSLIDYFFWHSLECVQTVTMLVKLNLCSWAHLLFLFSRWNRRTNSLSIPLTLWGPRTLGSDFFHFYPTIFFLLGGRNNHCKFSLPQPHAHQQLSA